MNDIDSLTPQQRTVAFSNDDAINSGTSEHIADFEADDAVIPHDTNSDTALMPATISAMASPDNENSNVTDEPPSLDLLTVEIKFHLNQMGLHVIEVGKRLLLAKELVPYGDWANWLQVNFNLKKSAAYNFMNIAKRFGQDFQSIGKVDISTFKPTQLIALLALPEGEEEKFIEEKSAEGKPVDEMTVKNLREEIRQYKTSLEQATTDYYGVLSEVYKLQDTVHELNEQIYNLERYPPPPTDYEALEKELAASEKELAELRDRPVEYAFPVDYEPLKNENAALKAREESFKNDYAVKQALELIFHSIPSVLNYDNLQNVIADFSSDDLTSFRLQLEQLLSLLSSFDSNH